MVIWPRSPFPAFPRGEHPLDLGEQAVEFYGFGLEIVAAGGDRLLAVARHRVRGQRDDRDVAGRGVGLQAPRRLPAVDLQQVQIHQDQVGKLGRRHRDPGGPVRGAEDLVVAEHIEPQGQHVEVILVVFDVEKLAHIRPRTHRPARPLTSSNSAPTRAISSAGANAFLERICSTPPLSRRRSSAVRSSAVTTTTGMSRHEAFAWSAATTSNPSISGIIKSSNRMSGTLAFRESRASRPLAASRTTQPWAPRIVLTSW